ncbi:NAD(P)-dependent oxidoreductase [Aminobacter sp. MSH1]|uniref:NAD-dependent epimerase/dehydratase family protein n=1 Tax=Aminobacter sp. MSH1 TaxID=374606 RepID=UPI000D395EAC|nr:NAD(P)-dependent oxidoreductase [Aminobacter sp. MSH1]
MPTKQKVLLTGAGGLLGSFVAREFAAGYDVTGLDLKGGNGPGAFIAADMTDFDAVDQAVKGMDVVVHVAALANIWAGTPDRIFSVNVSGTYNVLEAAERNGIRRVVICSSDSVHGFTVRNAHMQNPQYLPIDENHPLAPTDAYALSKQVGEAIAESYARRGKLEIVIVRPVFVLFENIYSEVAARCADPKNYKGGMAGGPNPAGGGPAWNYVDPRDLARAFRLAVELQDVTFERFLICGPNTVAPEPTLDRIREFLGYLPEVRNAAQYDREPFAPLYDLSHARDRLGYIPQHDLRPHFVK